jgi:hypothetical protein
MANDKEVKVRIKGEDQSSPAFKSASQNAKLFTKDIQGVSSALMKMAGPLVAFFGIQKVGDFFGKSLGEFDESVRQATKLEFLLKKNTDATDENVKSLIDQAQAMQDLGVIGNDVVVALQAQLATFELSTDTIKRMTPAITDMIVAEKGLNATTEDMIGFGNAFGMAMEGNYASLSKRGFKIDEATKKIIELGTEEEKARAITNYLTETYGGLNEQMAETSQGRMANLQNRFSDFRKQAGELTSFFRNEMITALMDLANGFDNLISDDVAEGWNKKLAKLWNDLSFGITNIFPLIAERTDRLWDKIFGVDTSDRSVDFYDAIIKNQEEFEKKWQSAGKGVIDTNSEVGESVDDLYEKFSGIDEAKDIAKNMKTAFESVSKNIIRSFETQTTAVGNLRKELEKLEDQTKNQLKSAEEAYQSQITSIARRAQENIASIDKQIADERSSMTAGWRTRIKELEEEKAKEQSILKRVGSEGVNLQKELAKDELDILKEKYQAEVSDIKEQAEEKKRLAEQEILERNQFMLQQAGMLTTEGMRKLVSDEMTYAGSKGYGEYSYVFNFNGDVNDKEALMRTIINALDRQSTLKEYSGE